MRLFIQILKSAKVVNASRQRADEVIRDSLERLSGLAIFDKSAQPKSKNALLRLCFHVNGLN
jgi:hypothetical protein